MKRVIITGGSDGLGAAFGRLCAKEGMDVVCLSRSKPDYDAVHIPTDLSDEASIAEAVKSIQQKYVPFDALVNCAGVYSAQKPDEILADELKRVFSINVLGPTFLISQLFDAIKSCGADILNVISTIGSKVYEGQGVYGSSKWAERGMTQYFQLELKNSPCRVIQFSPGGMKTGFFRKFFQKDTDVSKYMDVAELAKLMLFILKLPKGIEVSDIVVNRK